MKKGPFKMKGSPMQRNFGIEGTLVGGATRGKLKKTEIGPKAKPMLDENLNKIPDTIESITSKQGIDPKQPKKKSKKPKSGGGNNNSKSSKQKQRELVKDKSLKPNNEWQKN